MAFQWSRHCGYICVILTLLPLIWCNTQDICNRDPPTTTASRTPGDNGFRIKIVGRPQPERYTPEQVYTVVINGTYPNQRLLGFMLVAVPLNARDESTAMGTFQHLSSGVSEFARDCPYVVKHTSSNAKAGVEVLWTAPPAGTGCIEFRATVIEYNDIWYKNDGALTTVFCEETGTTENHQSSEMIPECCACGTAKYQMTFHGTWSHRTHPKHFPEKKRLLHWSNIVGASHSKHYAIWQYGGYATEGIRQVCEFGYTRILEQEMRQHSRDVRTVVKTPGIWWSDPHGLEQTRWARFSVDKKNHLVSMLSMLGPSPDWCIGISAINLCLPNCTWTGDLEMELFPWDAGTDEGVTYMSTNKASDPQQKIHRITNTFPNNPEAPFFGRDPIKSMATLKIRRIHPKVGDQMVCTGTEDFDEIDDNIEESDDLTLLDDVEKKRLIMMKQGKCAMSDWVDWSRCSVTCGVGQRFRKRTYLDSNMSEDICGEPTMESENCIGIENECEKPDEECAVARWSDWSPCSVTCGKGTRQHQRFYYNPDDKIKCNRKLEEVEICSTQILDCSKAISMLNFTAICSEPKAIGRCRADFTRYYYNTTMAKCLPFSYSGCRGNSNNFMTEDECLEVCFPVMKAAIMRPAQTEDETLSGSQDQNNEKPDYDADDDTSTVCSLPSEVGPCRARMTRYYFDSSLLTCVPFRYGGCKGNENNFLSEDACMDKCFMAMKQEMVRRRLQQDKQLLSKQQQEQSDTSAETKINHGKHKGKHGGANKPEETDKETKKAKNKKENNSKKHKKHKDKKGDAVSGHGGSKVNCIVSEWSEFSSCSSSCGRGYKFKRRMVKREPENGGKKCPRKLEKKKRCKLPKCKKGRHQQEGGVQGEGHHEMKGKAMKRGQGHLGRTVAQNNEQQVNFQVGVKHKEKKKDSKEHEMGKVKGQNQKKNQRKKEEINGNSDDGKKTQLKDRQKNKKIKKGKNQKKAEGTKKLEHHKMTEKAVKRKKPSRESDRRVGKGKNKSAKPSKPGEKKSRKNDTVGGEDIMGNISSHDDAEHDSKKNITSTRANRNKQTTEIKVMRNGTLPGRVDSEHGDIPVGGNMAWKNITEKDTLRVGTKKSQKEKKSRKKDQVKDKKQRKMDRSKIKDRKSEAEQMNHTRSITNTNLEPSQNKTAAIMAGSRHNHSKAEDNVDTKMKKGKGHSETGEVDHEKERRSKNKETLSGSVSGTDDKDDRHRGSHGQRGKGGKTLRKEDKNKKKKTDRKDNNKDRTDRKSPSRQKPNPMQTSKRSKVRDCVITAWSDWSHCSVTCARGFQFKRRIIELVEKNGGKPCPTKLEMKRRCELDKCTDERCKMSDWGLWTPCPKTCGSGSIQERTRQVISAPDGDTTVCGPRLERRYCTLPPCPTQKGAHKSHQNASCSYKVFPLSDYERLAKHIRDHRRHNPYRSP